MKANKVLQILQINRVTLYRYVKDGKIKVKMQPSGHYDYDDDSVYAMAGVKKRFTALYARSVTGRTNEQILNLENFAKLRGIGSILVFRDDSCGYNPSREGLTNLLDRVLKHEIRELYIENTYALLPLGHEMIYKVFEDAGCKVISMDSVVDPAERTRDIELISNCE